MLIKRDPKKIIKRCERHGCNKVATQQTLTSLGLIVFDFCDEHYKETHDSELEKVYLKTFEKFGPWGIKDLDDYFRKLTSKT